MDEQLHILTGSYALNALEGDERAAFEQHALASEQTREEVRGLSATAAMLAHGVDPVRPPQRVKDMWPPSGTRASFRRRMSWPTARSGSTTAASGRLPGRTFGSGRGGLRLGAGRRGTAAGAEAGTDELAARAAAPAGAAVRADLGRAWCGRWPRRRECCCWPARG
ncbi:hypothetical protein [Arthrobacter sp. Marseille-P9274]|uniref:hypothetical protein n=1 Tax=Arthrobacter sp. Marseille-P9274 TaxID=2866572 RepID=UPI0021C8DFC0|nr:hypothetical protein [Arthrobacter sp. Marseille-P9274]